MSDRSAKDPNAGPDDGEPSEAEITHEVEVGESRNVEFPCGECGADMVWDPETDALTCDYCGHQLSVPRGSGIILERDLADVPEGNRGLGLELRVAGCDTCGAHVTFDSRVTSELCVYCGSANVLEQEANRNAIRPESLVPLDVSRTDVESNFKAWIQGLWFRPNALKRTREFHAVGIYVPYWTFDARVHSDWSADAGYYYYVTQTYTTRVNGKTQVRTRQVRKVRWRPAWGSRDDAFDDHLVHASQGQPAGLVRSLGPFKTEGLVPYRPEYLAGWRAEEYSLDLEQGWKRAQEDLAAIQESRCSGDVPGDTQRDLRVQNTISGVRWKHVLLPIWSLQYRFGGKVYTVLIHGQSGKIVGKAPYSWIKITLLVLMIAATAGIVALVVGLASEVH